MRILTGKVALVTGAASKRGIGHAVALRLAGEGADIALVDRFDAPASLYSGDEGWKGLSEVAQEIGSLNRKAIALKADVSRSKEVRAAVKQTVERFGKIDILVNCAGIPGKRDTSVVKMSQRDWETALAVNLTGSFLTSKYVADHMIRRGGGGKIVHISSVRGKIGRAEGAHYAASKFGVIGLVQSLALELAPYRVNVNAICPGFVATSIRDEWCRKQALIQNISIDEARNRQFQKWSSIVPLGRIGTTEDIANLILFLVSPGSDYMTGQAMNITGGRIMH